jgi:aspartate dehydrogenase
LVISALISRFFPPICRLLTIRIVTSGVVGRFTGGEKLVTKVCLIGYGAIARILERTLDDYPESARVVGVLGHSYETGRKTPHGIPYLRNLEALFAAEPDIVVECAGHDAIKSLGPALLEAGVALVLASVGALADAELERSLRDSMQKGGGRLIIPSGAIAGLDGIAAAKIVGIDTVQYRSRKPPRSWKGTAAEGMVDLDNLSKATIFFRGDAREACMRFPQNANVTAAIALAGVGFENTGVVLEVDPETISNEHQILVTGPFGLIEIAIKGTPLPDNPKTSTLAAYSLVHALLREAAEGRTRPPPGNVAIR